MERELEPQLFRELAPGQGPSPLEGLQVPERWMLELEQLQRVWAPRRQ